MWKTTSTNLLTKVTLTLVFTFILWDTTPTLGLAEKRLCADEQCKGIISYGKGLINYHAAQKGMVSFQINTPMRIKSKEPGNDDSAIWGVEVNGRQGFAPKKFIREERVVIKTKDLKLVEDAKPVNNDVPAIVPHILNSSESAEEATTTTPLEAVDKNSNEKTITSDPVENVSNQQPQNITPVQQETVVDGTRIPTLADMEPEEEQREQSTTSQMNKESEEIEDDDDEIGDYDDDEEEEGNSNEFMAASTNPFNVEPTTIVNNIDSSIQLEKSAEPLTYNGIASEKLTDSFASLNDKKVNSSEINISGEDTSNSPNNEAINEQTEQLATPKVLNENAEIPVVSPIATESVTESTPVSLDSVTTESVELKQTVEGNQSISESSENEQQQVPTEEKQDGTENTEQLVNITNEALPTAIVEENHTIGNISLDESLPDSKTTEPDTTENSSTIDNTEPEDKLADKPIIDEQQNTPAELSVETAKPAEIQPPLYQYSTEAPRENVQTSTEASEIVFETPLVNSETQASLSPQQDQTGGQDELHVHENPLLNSEAQAMLSPQVDPHSAKTVEEKEILASENPLLNSEPQPTPSPKADPYQQTANEYVITSPYNPYDHDDSSNTPLPPQGEYNSATESPSANEIPHYDYPDHQPVADFVHQETPTVNPNERTENIPEVDGHDAAIHSQHQNPSNPDTDQQLLGQGSAELVNNLITPDPPAAEVEIKAPPPVLSPPNYIEEVEKKDNKGLFATIMDTVNNILPNNKKTKHSGYDNGNELDRILYSDAEEANRNPVYKTEEEQLFCEKLGPNECPNALNQLHHQNAEECVCSLKTLITTDFTLDTFVQALSAKVLENSELLAFLSIVAATILFFIFGYYCFCNSSNEGALLSKLNQLESSLLASQKENSILNHNLMLTRQKLASIEDNSFGSNDMVVSLRNELQEELVEKGRLQDQITALQKELENAADAGIELNKIVSELLSNQTGDESIISSVEELQRQLNEQQHTILEINTSLAEKSRENSELQLLIAEHNARYEAEISNLQRDNDELEAEKSNLQTRLEEIRTDFDKDITAALESKNFEIKRLQNEIVDVSAKVDGAYTKWQTSVAKVEALEECLKNIKRDPNVNITQVIDVANVRAELLDAQRKFKTLKERLELELDARKLSENQLEIATGEVEKLKQDFNQSEKDKLEAQTRLEVLSNYFKDKENQLQKELSLKETMWLKQQGETTTTVDRLTTMQEEIQSLKSQNDALRAEIEAQVAAHKAQTGTLENRAHETWLAARQSDRRYEEARAEATALRRRLTALAGGNVNEANKPSAGTAGLGDDLTNAPSPIHMESPGSPMLGRMPPPPFLPPPFMGPPPPFMGMPPPPFVPPGEMRPAPLGRIMSPPPPQRSGGPLDYEDYLDYESNNSWHRHTYSPPPRTYRSLSPTDSRYNYGTERDLMSTYDTETDFSPPPSPPETRRRGGGGGYGSDKGDINSRNPYNNSKKNNSGNKANISSGSDRSYNSSSKHGSKSKSSGAGKSIV